MNYYSRIPEKFRPVPFVDTAGLIPTLTRHEVARVYFNKEGDVTDQYKNAQIYGGWRQTHSNIVGDNVRWCYKSYYTYFWQYWFEPGYLYPNNLRSMFDELGISFTLIDQLSQEPVNVTTPILQNVKYPFVKSLAAKGFRVLYNDIIENGKRMKKSVRNGKLHECLCVPKSFVDIMQKYRLDVTDIDLAASYGVELTADDFFWLAVQRPPRETMDFLMEFCEVTEIRRYLMDKQNQAGKKDTYSKKLETQMTWWRDYLSMSMGLECDMADRKILFPHDLKAAHDSAMTLSSEKPHPYWDQRIGRCYEQLNAAYSCTGDEYLIRPPKNYIEFAVEGNVLKHCVCKNMYYEKHVAGSSLIFFIRATVEPDIPLYTIEYNPRDCSVKQCYGYQHSQPSESAALFVGKWIDMQRQKKPAFVQKAA